VDQNPEPATSGWTFGKVVGLILGIIGMVGFGVCTLCGLAFFSSDGSVWVLILAGALMTTLSVWLMLTMIRKAREGRRYKDNSNYP
jgi:predicted phage tail protein